MMRTRLTEMEKQWTRMKEWALFETVHKRVEMRETLMKADREVRDAMNRDQRKKIREEAQRQREQQLLDEKNAYKELFETAKKDLDMHKGAVDQLWENSLPR